VDDLLEELDALHEGGEPPLPAPAEGRALFEVALQVEGAAGQPGPFAAGAELRLRLRVLPEDYDEWLYVYVWQRLASGRWAPLFPNFADHDAPLAVPGVELWAPEPGSGYHLRASPGAGEVTLRAFATPQPLDVPVLFERNTMRWLARGPEGEHLRRGLRRARREALRQLHARWHGQPGLLAVAEQTLRIAPAPA
jgi:hypothetical protein